MIQFLKHPKEIRFLKNPKVIQFGVWGSLRTNFGYGGHFGAILGLRVSSGQCWVRKSLCADFQSEGYFWPISGSGVIFGSFWIYGVQLNVFILLVIFSIELKIYLKNGMGQDLWEGMEWDLWDGMGLVLISKNDPNPKWDWDSILKFGMGSGIRKSGWDQSQIISASAFSLTKRQTTQHTKPILNSQKQASKLCYGYLSMVDSRIGFIFDTNFRLS